MTYNEKLHITGFINYICIDFLLYIFENLDKHKTRQCNYCQRTIFSGICHIHIDDTNSK